MSDVSHHVNAAPPLQSADALVSGGNTAAPSGRAAT